MQQRRLRLGDILDDYCPRERRITNNAVVAMIEDDVKQTRCTTCDTEHEFKHAKVPRQRRKSEGPAALYSQVAAGNLLSLAIASAVGALDADREHDVLTALRALPDAMSAVLDQRAAIAAVAPQVHSRRAWAVVGYLPRYAACAATICRSS